MMDKRSFYSTGTLALLAALFIGLVILSETVIRGARLDLTRNGLYTLSEGTRNILGKLEEPVKLYFYFSEDASTELPQLRAYAKWVGEMLDEMAERAGGRLVVERVNPRPFSPEEDEATQFGLQGVPVGAAGDTLYFGLVGTNTVDDVQVMPFLQPAKEQFLEYDLAKMISTLSHPVQKKVGILSGLDIGPGFDMQTRQPRPPWVIYEQLGQLFDVSNIDPATGSLPEDLDLLLLIHPKDLSESLRYQVDQFALSGGRLVVFLDPLAETDQGGNPQDPMARLNAGSASTLDGLLEAWGVTFDPSRVVGDIQYALQVSLGGGMAPQRHLGILSVTGDGLNADDIISADLEAVNLASSGWLEVREGAATRFAPLITSSENAGPLDANQLRFLANPQDLMTGFQPTGDRYVVAARVSGPAESAFESPPEGQDAADHRSESVEGGIQVILVADTDLLSDRMWVSRQPFFGQQIVSAFADNGNLLVNAVDNLLGSDDLISIRTRTSSARPFERVEALRLQAEGQYRAREEALNRDLEATELKLSEMQANRSEGDLTVLDEQQQAEIERFIDQRLRIRSELRQVRHDLDREIDALGTQLKVINIAIAPFLIVVVALLSVRRRRRVEVSS